MAESAEGECASFSKPGGSCGNELGEADEAHRRAATGERSATDRATGADRSETVSVRATARYADILDDLCMCDWKGASNCDETERRVVRG